MSNLYGYSDYNGPQKLFTSSSIDSCDQPVTSARTTTTTTSALAPAAVAPENDDANDDNDNDDNDDDETDNNNNPLQVGFWMEGDSLAPPCGTSISTIHQILSFAQVDEDDVLYDLGCGDGRICLEAYATRRCRTTIGIEVEEDLVQRAHELIARLPVPPPPPSNNQQPDLPRVIQADLRAVLDSLIETARPQKNRSIVGNGDSKNPNSSTVDMLPLPTVIILYLLPEALVELAPRFQELLMEESQRCTPSGGGKQLRIVCNTWGLLSWRPILHQEIAEENSSSGGKNIITTSLFLYTSESFRSGNANVDAS